MKRVLLLSLFVLVSASTSKAADMVKACYQMNGGQLRVLIAPDRCRDDELSISLATGDVAPRLDPELFDASGQYLGVPMGDAFYIPSMKKFAVLDVSNGDNNAADLFHGALYYMTTDCTGDAFIIPETYGNLVGESGWRIGVLTREYIERVNGKYYISGEKFSFARSTQSTLRFNGDWSCYQEGNWGDQAAQEVTLPFTTPVALPLELRNPTIRKLPAITR